jgi:hypothetical protein
MLIILLGIYLVSLVASYRLTRKFYAGMSFIKPDGFDVIFTIVPLLNTINVFIHIALMFQGETTDMAGKFFRIKK